MNLNTTSCEILDSMIEEYKSDIEVHDFNFPEDKTVRVIDFGVNVEGKKEDIGTKIADVSMGSLGKVKISDGKIDVTISEKVPVATLSCQLAGWAISVEEKTVALGSGPARILAGKPHEIIDKVGYFEESKRGALILETDILPGEKVCEALLHDAKTNELFIAAFKGKTIVGLINVMARVIELSVFRLDVLGYDANRIKSAKGKAELPDFNEEDENLMFLANDKLIYESSVSLSVEGWDESLMSKISSKSSNTFGKSFKEIYESAGRDFYKIPKDIFTPAKVEVVDIKSGETYSTNEL